jgi:hypothetical protein
MLLDYFAEFDPLMKQETILPNLRITPHNGGTLEVAQRIAWSRRQPDHKTYDRRGQKVYLRIWLMAKYENIV